MAQFFLYRHLRNDTNTPFYIGVGKKKSNSQTIQHEYQRAFEYRGRNALWKNIVNKHGRTVEILFESDVHEIILSKEIEFIKLYGRLNIGNGTLCNFTNGGDGTHGRVMSYESRLKTSNTLLGHPVSEETRKKFSLNRLGTKLTEVQKNKISKALCGRPVSEETREKLSKKLKGRKYSPETIKKMSLGQIGKKASDTNRLKRSSSMKKTWKKRKDNGFCVSDETRLKISKGQIGRIMSVATRSKISNTLKSVLAQKNI